MVNMDQIMSTYFRSETGRPLTEYEIDDAGLVNVFNNKLSLYKPTQKLPVKFGKVQTLMMFDKGLTTLEGVPNECDGIVAAKNKLTNLAHCTAKLRYLNVSNNKLTTLEGSLRSVHMLDVMFNPLKSLDGLENMEVNEIRIHYTEQLPLLKLLVAKEIFIVKHYMQEMVQLSEILNKHAGTGKQGAIKCAAELIKAGYKENARW